MLAQGNALGFGIDRCALQGRRNPPPLQGGQGISDTFPGVVPGWHAPGPWRVNVAEFAIGESRHGPVYERGSSLVPARLEQAQRVHIHKDGSLRNFLLFSECE